MNIEGINNCIDCAPCSDMLKANLRKQLLSIARDALKLSYLEEAGIDNTTAYEEGMAEFHKVHPDE